MLEGHVMFVLLVAFDYCTNTFLTTLLDVEHMQPKKAKVSDDLC